MSTTPLNNKAVEAKIYKVLRNNTLRPGLISYRIHITQQKHL